MIVVKTCLNCSKYIESIRSTKRYCNGTCRQYYNRKRQNSVTLSEDNVTLRGNEELCNVTLSNPTKKSYSDKEAYAAHLASTPSDEMTDKEYRDYLISLSTDFSTYKEALDWLPYQALVAIMRDTGLWPRENNKSISPT